MEITAKIGENNYRVHVGKAHDISIPVRFGNEQLLAFGAPPAGKTPFKADDFIGDVGQGGSCNCDVLQFSPHLHGTHTECVGHITDADIFVHDILKESLIPATVVTIAPENNARDSYMPALRAGDAVITQAAMEKALAGAEVDFSPALIIRTLPNDDSKMIRHYTEAPFFSREAMNAIVRAGVKHLVVDVPSIDRIDDEGRLTNHHIFWGIAEGSHAVKTPSPKTVTELAYIANHIKDGRYMLNLQLAAFAADAAPSRPLLYPVEAL